MSRPLVNLRIGVVQLNPKIGEVQANINKARELCRKIEPRSLDLLCFPEMAFTGYAFNNASEILPYLEQPKTGVSSQFCSEIAKTLECYVLAGYPERLTDEELIEIEEANKERTSTPLLTPKEEEIHQVGANSAAFYGPDGTWIGGYRKTHLFETDKTWAKAGTGFTTFHLPHIQTLSLGICMDLNPQVSDWTLDDGPFEIADYCISQKSNILVLLSAWLDTRRELKENEDWSTLNYWAMRTKPLWRNEQDDEDRDSLPPNQTISDSDGHETIVVICNRIGEENDKVFAGSSSIFSMQRGAGRPKLLDVMGRREEDVRIWNIKVHQTDEANQ